MQNGCRRCQLSLERWQRSDHPSARLVYSAFPLYSLHCPPPITGFGCSRGQMIFCPLEVLSFPSSTFLSFYRRPYQSVMGNRTWDLAPVVICSKDTQQARVNHGISVGRTVMSLWGMKDVNGMNYSISELMIASMLLQATSGSPVFRA